MIEKHQGLAPEIDEQAFVHERATVIGEVVMGPGSSAWPSAVLRGDEGLLRIGAKTNIQDGAICHTTAGVSKLVIGDRVTVGHGAIVHGALVGDDCIIGMGSILLDNAEISRWSIVGAGALVPPGKKFPEGVLLIGSPAKVAREITEQEREMIEHSWKVYAELTEERLREAMR
ncbi:MAG: gamma carbonic anhydrase family protein [Myxococcota bacterium]